MYMGEGYTCNYVVIKPERKAGILLCAAPFQDKLVCYKVTKAGVLTEVPHLEVKRKLFGRSIKSFKANLNKQFNSGASYKEVKLELDEKDTLTVSPEEQFSSELFQNLFFTDTDHWSTSEFHYGEETELRKFKTFRGTKLLLQIMQTYGLGLSVSEWKFKFDESLSNK